MTVTSKHNFMPPEAYWGMTWFICQGLPCLELVDISHFSGIQAKLVKWGRSPSTACAGNVPIKHMPQAKKASVTHDSSLQAHFHAICGILRHDLTHESWPGLIWSLWNKFIFRNWSKVGQVGPQSYYCLCKKCPNKAYAKSKKSLHDSWQRPPFTFSCHQRHIEAWFDPWVKAWPHLEATALVHFSGIQAKLVKWCGCPITACASNVPIKLMKKKKSLHDSWLRPPITISCHHRHIEAWFDPWVKGLASFGGDKINSFLRNSSKVGQVMRLSYCCLC